MGENSGREFHAVADLFPLMQGEAFAELVADIKKNGLRESILVDGEGRILDGRNRYRACLEAGVEPCFEEWKGEGDLADLALSRNLRRRHLDESQRAMVAARLAMLMEAEAIKRRGRTTEFGADLHRIPHRRSAGEAAGVTNVSPRLVNYGIRILRDGCPELIAAVDSGRLAVTPAAELAKLSHEEQAKAVAAGPAARKVREMRGEGSAATAPEASPFGLVRGQAPEGPDSLRLIWVPAPALTRAVKALKAGGFRYQPEA